VILFAVALAVVAPTGDVDVAGSPRDDPPVVRIVDGLVEGDVLTFEVSGFESFSLAQVSQCERADGGGLVGCTNTFPVQFGENGHARFQYKVRDHADCGPSASCVAVIEDADTRAVVYTVFGASAPAKASVRLEPEGPYEPGDLVAVHVDGLEDSSRATVQLCAPECGAAFATNGSPVPLELKSRCPKDEACAVRVLGLSTQDQVIPLAFVAAPGVDYEAMRVVFSIGLAAVLAAVAILLIRRTDWRAPTEAATPALDAAEV
jgi:hypothetical protein